jgi:hypothetical protein
MKAHGVIKDNQLTRTFHITDAKTVIAGLELDIKFLEAHNLIDYSLLFGTIPLATCNLGDTLVEASTAQEAKSPQASTSATTPASPLASSNTSKDTNAVLSPSDSRRQSRLLETQLLESVTKDILGSSDSDSDSDTDADEPASLSTAAKAVKTPTCSPLPQRPASAPVDRKRRPGAPAGKTIAVQAGEDLDNLPLLLASHGEVFTLGIIDFLAPYETKKKIANFFKTIRFDAHTLSTIPAPEYAERMIDYLPSIIVDCECNDEQKRTYASDPTFRYADYQRRKGNNDNAIRQRKAQAKKQNQKKTE